MVDPRRCSERRGRSPESCVRKIRHKVKDDAGVLCEIDPFRDVKLVIRKSRCRPTTHQQSLLNSFRNSSSEKSRVMPNTAI
jgi:hypothetical protein